MALTIETGTGVAGADSFETQSGFSAFIASYYGTAPIATVPMQEAGLRRAFYYMQALRWKSGVYPTFGGAVPAAIRNAQSLFANAELASPGALSPDVTLAGQKILNKVDSIGWEVIGKDAGVEASRPIITSAFDFLRPYLEFDPARDKSVGYTGAMVV